MKTKILLFIAMLFASVTCLFAQVDSTAAIGSDPGWNVWNLIFPGDFSSFASVTAIIAVAITQVVKWVAKLTGKEITKAIYKILISIAVSAVYLVFGYLSGKAVFLQGAEWYEIVLTILVAGLSGSGAFDLLKSLVSKEEKDTSVEIGVVK
ncbi:hypothetical protein [Parabacteroides sp. Marseille-P3160]|uniref:hypothetical protein n=1 Tax=Parabacteroides sp. Marseille-P3160 TaxID=1917887 RepID=UPI0009BBAD64|nr:hypothetical protein [Parabacteroides sp. Marseille-P3160]